MAQQLFRDRICLSLDESNLARALSVARDFRSCALTVKVGPAILLAEGPTVIRALRELGITDIIVDARLCGHQSELWTAITEVSQLSGVRAITVQAILGRDILALAVEAAIKSTIITKRIEHPKILASLLPGLIDLPFMQVADSRKDYIHKTTKMCHEAGVHGMVVDYSDIRQVRCACKTMPVLASAKRQAMDYTKVLSKEEAKKPGVSEILGAGAACAFFDSSLIGRQDVEWIADMLTKELETVKRSKRDGVNRYLPDALRADFE